MLKIKWACAFLVLGFLVAMQSFAGSHDIPDGIVRRSKNSLWAGDGV